MLVILTMFQKFLKHSNLSIQIEVKPRIRRRENLKQITKTSKHPETNKINMSLHYSSNSGCPLGDFQKTY